MFKLALKRIAGLLGQHQDVREHGCDAGPVWRWFRCILARHQCCSMDRRSLAPGQLVVVVDETAS